MPIFRNEEGRNVDSKLTCGYESCDAKIIIVGTPIAIDSYAPKVNRYIIRNTSKSNGSNQNNCNKLAYSPKQ